MKKYVVAYIDWFDNELKINFVNAESELCALYDCAYFNEMEIRNNISSVEEFQQECFNNDCMIAAKEIPNGN